MAKEQEKYKQSFDSFDWWTIEYDLDLGGAYAKMHVDEDGDTYIKNSPFYMVPQLLMILKLALELGYSIEPTSIGYNYDFGSGFIGVIQRGKSVVVRDVASPLREGEMRLYVTHANLKDLRDFKSVDHFVDDVEKRRHIFLPDPFA